MKVCKKCNEEKSFDFFYLQTSGYYYPYCKECNTARSREWRSNNKHQKYLNDIKVKFNVTNQQYDELFKAQKGSCAICEKKEINRRLSVDHCHKTLKVRGLVCRTCNLGIGYFMDDIALLKKAIKYLK